MSYEKMYTENQRNIHSRYCGDCDIYDLAKKNIVKWNFKECKKLKCYKLSQEEFAKNYCKYNREFKEPSLVDKFVSDEKKRKHIISEYVGGRTQEEIADLYGVDCTTINSVLKKCGIRQKHRKTHVRWYRQRPSFLREGHRGKLTLKNLFANIDYRISKMAIA